MKYPNLKAEMVRTGTTGKMIAGYLGIRETTLSTWINGTTDAGFPISKAAMVRDEFFEGMSLDYLFSETPSVPTTALIE